MSRCFHYLALPALLAGLAASTACSRRAERLDQRDENHPLMRRALARKQAGDTGRALALFHQALERRPSLARAHLELGLLYDQDQEDFVRAIYHYERYLEKRPQAQKHDLIEQLAREARLAYAASLPDQPSGAVQMIAELRRENERLRAALQQAQETAAPSPSPVARPARPEADTRPLPAPVPAPAADAKPETYTVQVGDTLSRIAATVYGDPAQYERLFEANRHVLNSPGSVRPGQILIVPRNQERTRHE